MRQWILYCLSLIALVAIIGCPADDDDDTAESEIPTADLDMDSDRTGEIELTDEEEAAETEAPGVILRVNVDDDNLSGESDNESVAHVGDDENDLAPGVITFTAPDEVADGDTLQLTLSGTVEAFRLYIDQQPIMGMGGSGPITEKTLAVSSGDSIDIQVEGVDWFATALLEMEFITADGEQQSLDQVQLTTTPWLMQHHFDDAHELWIVDAGFENGAAITLLEDELGEENVHKLPAVQVGWDVWVQDEIQYGYEITPDGPVSVVMDTIRDGQGYGGLVDFPPEELLGQDRGRLVVGDGLGNGYDYGGNLECSPPMTANGVDYPYGRIYYGSLDAANQGPHPLVREFFAAQTLQSPVQVDTTFLAVGHIDEYMSFIPDPDAPRGFRVLFTDHQLAVDILESVDPNLSIPKYAAHGYSTAGEILDDAIMDYSADIDATHTQGQLEVFKDEFELADEEIILIPAIWEQTNWGALAMVTGMVNLLAFDDKLFIPDPWFRDITVDEEDANGNFILDPGEDLNEDGMLSTHNDPFIDYVESVLPTANQNLWIDTWRTYHLMWGEIHCGTEVRRTPTAAMDWWEVGYPE